MLWQFFSGKEEEWLEFILKFQAFLVTKECAEAIQTNFKWNLPATKNEELYASTKLGKVKKLPKMKNSIAMVYATQYLSVMAMLNAIFNVQAETGWPTRRTCQLIDDLKHKYN